MSATNDQGAVDVPPPRAGSTSGSNRQESVSNRRAGSPAGNPHRQNAPYSGTPRGVLVVTTDILPGYEVRHVLGEVLGVLARPRNPYSEGVKALSGKSVDSDVSAAALMRWRQEAIVRMAHQARERGANAVIGLRFDHRDITGAWGEICAYGTAVVVEPVTRHDPRTFAASWPD
jgi:uncharacterized protein YbjQ (UPF0145 family)